MNRIEELKKEKNAIILEMQALKLSIAAWDKLASHDRKTMNYCTKALEFLDDEIRIEELVYFCQNGAYPNKALLS